MTQIKINDFNLWQKLNFSFKDRIVLFGTNVHGVYYNLSQTILGKFGKNVSNILWLRIKDFEISVLLKVKVK